MRLLKRSVCSVVITVGIVAGGAVAPAAVSSVQAPQASVTLTGVVVDAQGGRVPAAQVTARLGALTRRAVADAQGGFTLALPPGAWVITITSPGFRELQRRIELVPDDDTPVTFTLLVADVAESVDVRAASAVVSTQSSVTRLDVPLVETPQSISVVTAGLIRDQAPPNLQETVRYTPGVRHELYGVDNRGDWISLRGSEESTTLLDGLRLPLTGWYGVVRTEPYAFERIEVLRGPSSIIAGANDPGGVVNLVSKRPSAATTRELGVRFGNHDRREARADFTGPVTGDGTLAYRVVGLVRDSGTQVRHADEQRALLAPSLTWRPSVAASVTWYGEYQYDRSKNTNAFLGLDGTLRPAPNGPIPTDVFIGEPAWDRYGGTRWRVGYAADWQTGSGLQFRHTLRHDRVDGVMKSMYAEWWNGFLDADGAPDANGRHLGRQWYVYDDRARVTAADASLTGRRATGPVTHTFVFGVDALRHRATQASAFGSGTPLNVYAPAYGTFAEPMLDASAVPVENTIDRIGLFAQNQMKMFDRLSVRVGVRQDRVSNAVDQVQDQTDWATTGNVGVVYQLRDGLAPYASVSSSFNPIIGTDAAGRAFKPKRGEQVELGLKWEASAVPVQVSAAWFTLKERNRLTPDPEHVGHSVQIGDARIRGAELEAKADARGWLVLAGYTYTRARASAAAWGGTLDPSQQLEGMPEHTASAWLVHDLGRRWVRGLRVGGGVRHVGRVGDGTGQVFVPAVTLIDALVSYDLRAWRLNVNANNLTDKAYIATCLARGDCWFGARRTIAVTIDFRY